MNGKEATGLAEPGKPASVGSKPEGSVAGGSTAGDKPNKPEGSSAGEGVAGEGEGEQAVKFRKVTKVVIKKLLRTYLHMCYQSLPEELAEKDCVYFLRHTPGMVPLPNNLGEAHKDLPQYLEMGVMGGQTLGMLEQLIAHVFDPLLSRCHRSGGTRANSATPSRPSTTMGDAAEANEKGPSSSKGLDID